MANIYLDTNIIFMLFENLAKASKSKKIRKVQLPEVIKSLKSKRKHRYFVSTLTKVEVFRHLYSNFGIKREKCKELWTYFTEFLKVGTLKEHSFDFDDIIKLVTAMPLKRTTIINIMHLMIAKKNRLILLTGDKGLIKLRDWYYKNIIDYKEFKNL